MAFTAEIRVSAVHSDIIRLGLIGAGRWGRNYIRTIGALPGVTLAAIASRNPATAQLVPRGCIVLEDWSDLVLRSDIDGVVIATPPKLHAPMLLGAARAGKAVLVEKPLVAREVDLETVEEAEASAKQVIMVENTHLYHPAFRALAAMARREAPISGIRASAGAHGPYRVDVPVLWDWGSHDLAMCLAIDAGPWVPEAALRIASRIVDGCVAERLHVALRARSGIVAELALSTLDDKHRWFAVDLAPGTLIYSDSATFKLRSFPYPRAHPQDSDGMPVPVADELPLTRAVTEFVEAIRNGERPGASLRTGKQVVRLLSAIDALLQAGGKSI